MNLQGCYNVDNSTQRSDWQLRFTVALFLNDTTPDKHDKPESELHSMSGYVVVQFFNRVVIFFSYTLILYLSYCAYFSNLY